MLRKTQFLLDGRLLPNLQYFPQRLAVTCGHSVGHSVTAQSIRCWAHTHVHVGARCSQSTAGKNLRSFPFFTALQFSASLFWDAHGCRGPARDRSVRLSRRRDSHILLILKYLRKLGFCPSEAGRQPVWTGVLTQIESESESPKDCAGHADPYLCLNADLCPLSHPVPFSTNNGELAHPTVCCSANAASRTVPRRAELPFCLCASVYVSQMSHFTLCRPGLTHAC